MVPTSQLAPELGALRDRFAKCGQGDLFALATRFDAADQVRLARQLASLDPAALAAIVAAARARMEQPPARLEPAPIDRLPERGGDAGLRERARARGLELLAAGAVAVLVVAGGQGTRLGFDGPKGAFPLGPVSQRSLFEQQAQKLRGAERRHARTIPWLVMTSAATDAACRAFFAASGHFGLRPEQVHFFVQGVMPAVDFAGRLLLEAPDRLALAPDGHGGVLPALAGSGLAAALADTGVRFLSYYQVDNPLVPIVDPLFLGLHDLRGAEMSCKVVEKRTPEERAGTLGLRGGRTVVIEYTEVDPWHRDAREPDGTLRFWAASIGVHVLSLDFVQRVAADAARILPWHASAKRIPHLGADGRRVVPDAPNGYKLERFVFDALPEARSAALLEVRRDEEYSPIKNRSDGESPCTARRDLVARYHRWLREGGARVPEGAWVELDEAYLGSAADVAAAPEEARAGSPRILFGNRGIA